MFMGYFLHVIFLDTIDVSYVKHYLIFRNIGIFSNEDFFIKHIFDVGHFSLLMRLYF